MFMDSDARRLQIFFFDVVGKRRKLLRRIVSVKNFFKIFQKMKQKIESETILD